MTAAAIIAGGRGTRLGGRLKGLLVVDGRRIIDRQREVLASVFDRVVLVANDPGPWLDTGLAVVPDRVTGAGPLAGVDAALAHFGPAIGGAVVCVACDMPFLDERVLRLLRDHQPDAPALVPRIAGLPQPLLARYSIALAPTIAKQMASGDLAMHHWLDHITVAWLDEPALRSVDPTLRSFTNINTLADHARAQPPGGR